MSKELEMDDATHDEITRLCEAGDELLERDDTEAALSEYIKAWYLIPEPRHDWEAATWVITALADCYFFLGDNKAAREALEYSMRCPGGIGNPYLHLRLGQVLFNDGELDAAADNLMRAYMFEGKEIFEEEDPKYLAFLGTRAIL